MRVVKTYEGFFDFFKKKKDRRGDPITGRLPKDIEPSGSISKKVKQFFEKTLFSDFNYIIKEITDEYGSYDLSYSLECEFGNFKLIEDKERFAIDGRDLKFMDKSQDFVLDRVGSYARICVDMPGFNDGDEGLITTQLKNINNDKMSKSEFVEDVAERIKDMCDFESFKVNSSDYDPWRKGRIYLMIFNF